MTNQMEPVTDGHWSRPSCEEKPGQDQPAAEGLGYVTLKYRIRSTFLAFCKVYKLFETDLPVTGQQEMQFHIFG